MNVADERMKPLEKASAQSVEARLIRRLLAFFGNPPFEFVLWNGDRVSPRTDPVATIHVSSRETLYDILRDPQIRVADAYSDGRVRIDGDLVALVQEVYRNAPRGEAGTLLQRVARLLHPPKHNTLAGSRENIHHHYDIGNDFYALWLGRTMAYTCAYYPAPDVALDAAQVAKMDHVCRKLWLKPGDTVVEAGFGWGALALHMAQNYGVKVKAFNIAHEQVMFARERARAAGVGDRVEYIEDDYRNIAGQYDAFVSVGMLEHVGLENYEELGRVAARAIGSAGRGLIHSIGRNRPASLNRWIEKRIFPGAYPPALSEMMHIFEPSALSVLDVENIRLHYARTLGQWLELFDASTDKVLAMFDEKFVRMWRMYLSGSIAAFTTGTLQLFQVVFASQENNSIPWTRDHLYR